MAAWKSRIFRISRSSILITVLAFSMEIHFLHLYIGVRYPSVHSICPFGGLENLWAFAGGRVNIPKVFSGTMALFFLTVLFSVIFKRAFCGNICPLGALQDIFGRLYYKKFKVPAKIDKYLLYLKYAVLVLSTFMAWFTMTLWISPYDPWAAFAHIASGTEMFHEYSVGTFILFAVIALSVFSKRPFCKYLCPAGALYGITGKISPSFIERFPDKCINCGLCSKKCPVDISVHTSEKIKTAECISCSVCVDVCPQPLVMIAPKIGSFIIRPLSFLLLSVSVFFGSILALDAAGLYQVAIPTVQEVINNSSYIRVSDLRGSMSIEAGAFYTGMELSAFYELMEIPQSIPKDTAMKNINQFKPDYDFHVMKAKKGSY